METNHNVDKEVYWSLSGLFTIVDKRKICKITNGNKQKEQR